MSNRELSKLIKSFQVLSQHVPLHPIRSADEYRLAVDSLNQLLDYGAANEDHPLADLAATLGSLIGDYDDVHFPSTAARGVEVIMLLLDQHNLKQSELPEVGTQGVVSEIITGKRDLNVRQIRRLKDRFGLSADVFV